MASGVGSPRSQGDTTVSEDVVGEPGGRVTTLFFAKAGLAKAATAVAAARNFKTERRIFHLIE